MECHQVQERSLWCVGEWTKSLSAREASRAAMMIACCIHQG